MWVPPVFAFTLWVALCTPDIICVVHELQKRSSSSELDYDFSGTILWLCLILEVGNISVGHKTCWRD